MVNQINIRIKEGGIKGDKGDTPIAEWAGTSLGFDGDPKVDLKGGQGIQGVQGIQGEQGVQGIQGEQGLQGDVGDTGLQGIQGIQGATGAQGSGVKITPWTAGAYLLADQVNHLGKDWVSNAATISTDVPGTSSKWVNRLSGIANGIVASGNVDAVSGGTVFKYTIPNQHLIKTAYNYIYQANNDRSLYTTNLGGANPEISIVPNTMLNNGYPNMIKCDLTAFGVGYAPIGNFGFFTKVNSIMTCVVDMGSAANAYITLSFNLKSLTAFGTSYSGNIYGGSVIGETPISNANMKFEVIDKIGFKLYLKATFYVATNISLTTSYRLNSGTQFIINISSFGLFDSGVTSNQYNILQTDDNVLNPYRIENKGLDLSLENVWNEDNGYYELVEYPTPTVATKIIRGFKNDTGCNTTILTTNPNNFKTDSIFKQFDTFTGTTNQTVQLTGIDTWPMDIKPTQTSYGFWVNLSKIKDYLILTTTGANRIYIGLKHISLGEMEVTDGILRITDKEGDYVFVNFINKVDVQSYIIIGLSSGTRTDTTVTLGGLTMVAGHHKLQGRIKYKSVAENNGANLDGLTVCMVGDSTTSGLVLAKRFGGLTGISKMYVAAVSGASIGNSVATNWIYNYKDFIVSANADLTIYNISSNDTAWNTGTVIDVDDAGVTNSFYKWYFQFMRYMFRNTTPISGTAILNLSTKAHFMCTWLVGDDSAQPNRRQSSIDKNKVVDELSRYWGCNFIDIHRSVGWTEESSTILSDGTHPNAFTHNKIVRKMLQEIGNYFKQ